MKFKKRKGVSKNSNGPANVAVEPSSRASSLALNARCLRRGLWEGLTLTTRLAGRQIKAKGTGRKGSRDWFSQASPVRA